MKQRHILTVGMAAVVAASALRLRRLVSTTPPVVGSWFGTVTATNPPLGQFNDLISFHPGGVVTESRRYSVLGTPLGTLLETTGHGAWRQRGATTVEVAFRFLLQDAASGDVLGTDNVRLALTLDRATRTLRGTFESQITDVADTVLATVTGDYAATPILV
jgi:hypothetical protein